MKGSDSSADAAQVTAEVNVGCAVGGVIVL